MAARRKPRKKQRKAVRKPKAVTREKDDLHIPGALLIAFGLMLLPVNYDLLPGLESLKAWPLLFVLFGFVLFIKSTLAKRSS